MQLETTPIRSIPYNLYSDPDIYAREQERIFRGHAWNFVGLEAEVPKPGDFKRTWLGDRPIVMVRGRDGAVNVVENVCAHRGVSFCFQEHGNTKAFQCPYHQWTYDLSGKLIGIPFRNGIGGHGGLYDDFDMSAHGLTTLHVARRNGVVYASYDPAMEPLEEYFNDNLRYVDRMFNGRELRILGYWRQRINCNWKLMVENLRDPYHATLLHVFLVAFSLNRADQPSSARLDRDGKHGAFTSRRGGDIDSEATKEIQAASKGFALQGPQLLAPVKEFPDADTLVIQSIWPNVIFQQQLNGLATRHIVPRGPEAFELHWTCFGYADDDEEMIARRRRQANLFGPAGFVSVDDSEVIEMIQRGATAYREAAGIVPMGGTGTESCDYAVTEAPLRAFHTYYRQVMGL